MMVIYYVAISADGFVATLDGGVDWLTPFQQNGEDYGYADFFASVDGLVMGHTTYDQVHGFGDWPYGDVPCWVACSRPIKAELPNIVATSDAPGVLSRQLMAQGHRRIWLVGGPRIASSFEGEGLLTDYILTVVPVFLGQGVPLFSSPTRPNRLTLTRSRIYSDGVVQLSYARNRLGCEG